MENKLLPAIFCIVLIITRIIFDGSSEINLFIKVINCAALIITIILIVAKIEREIREKINGTELPKNIKKREKTERIRTAKAISYTTLGLFCFIYFMFFNSSCANDVVSIFTLAISLSDEYIVEKIRKM